MVNKKIMHRFSTAFNPVILVLIVGLILSGMLVNEQAYAKRKTDTKQNNSMDIGQLEKIAPRELIVHTKGLQWLTLSNWGEMSNPDERQGFFPALEYPGGSGTQFLFSGGVWVGANKGGTPIVTTATDGDNGTNEFGPVMGWLMTSKETLPKESDDDGDWTAADDLNGNGEPDSDWDGPDADANGDGVFDYDPEPHIDEDPVGDISSDFIDNDFDGLIDEWDDDLDGDAVPGSNDDDGDGLEDEDGIGRAGEEYITAYVDTCEDCLDSPDADGFTPLGIRVVQHSYQWAESYADDFIIFDYLVTNVGNEVLTDVYLALFFDFDAEHITQGREGSEDDITFFIDSLETAIGGDPDADGGLLQSRYFGVRVLQTPMPDITTTYKNFERISGGDPDLNSDKYAMMSSGQRDPDVTMANLGDWRFLLAFGPLGDLEPKETLPVTCGIINGVDIDAIITNSRQALSMFQADFRGPSAPEVPRFTAEPMDGAVKITWEDNAESSIDPISKEADFEGYRVWRSPDGVEFTLLAEYDMINDIGYDLGMPEKNANGKYEYIDTGANNGFPVNYVVTAFDNGNNGDGINHPEQDRATGGVGQLESSRAIEVLQLIVPAKPVKDNVENVFVVPNPYIGSSRLETVSRTNPVTGDRYFPKDLEFRNLPSECTIDIYSLAGDHIRTIQHTNGTSYETWDLQSRTNQEIAPGVYFYRVEADGEVKIDKFVVVK
ncbi:T9SS type A sorting domain-containing protein [candidate division KSB1 bacterium]|nr:T9SS type A sorting domain-containing protein [candidate division KSB1 bacterium]